MDRTFIVAATTGIILAISAIVSAQIAGTTLKTGYAPVNGIKLYYEVHGTGEPLILLHGGLGSSDMFSEILPALSEGRQVITADLQAHGRTADINRPMTCEAMADDIAGLIKYLGLKKANVMGYSLGASVALRVAIQHPELVNKLIVVSTAFRRDGWYPEVLAGMAQVGPQAAEPMKQTPMYQAYARIAPQPGDWPVLLTKTGELIRTEYDWSTGVAAIKAPTLLVFGDADAVRPAHIVQFYELLGGGKRDAGWDGAGMSIARLAILPGRTHYNLFSSPLLASTARAFLDSPVAGGK